MNSKVLPLWPFYQYFTLHFMQNTIHLGVKSHDDTLQAQLISMANFAIIISGIRTAKYKTATYTSYKKKLWDIK